MKRLLEDAPHSKLLVSTRDQKLAEEVSPNCVMFGTLPSEGHTARKLLGQNAFDDEHKDILRRPDVEEYVTTILKVCAGHQLALCMAGRGLRTRRKRLKVIRKVFEVYTNQVKRHRRPRDAERSAQGYSQGLPYVLEASLAQCEQWAEKSMDNVDVWDLFCSLCLKGKW